MSERAIEELRNIVNAERFNRERFRDDTEFADWAQSRARHTLERIAKAAPPSPQSDEREDARPTLICDFCGADRYKEDCKSDRLRCPMRGDAALKASDKP